MGLSPWCCLCFCIFRATVKTNKNTQTYCMSAWKYCCIQVCNNVHQCPFQDTLVRTRPCSSLNHFHSCALFDITHIIQTLEKSLYVPAWVLRDQYAAVASEKVLSKALKKLFDKRCGPPPQLSPFPSASWFVSQLTDLGKLNQTRSKVYLNCFCTSKSHCASDKSISWVSAQNSC